MALHLADSGSRGNCGCWGTLCLSVLQRHAEELPVENQTVRDLFVSNLPSVP